MAKKPAKWEEDLEQEATDDAAREKARSGGTSNKVSTKNRRFTFGGENLGRELVGVIVDFAYLRTWFATRFDADKPGIPQCWALSEDGEDMAPPDDVEDAQSTACEGCAMNEWGSGKGGKGDRGPKACGDRRRLGFLHEDDIKSADDVEEAIAAMIEISPTSTGPWSAYLKELKNKHKRPVYSVLTKLSFDPEVSYPKVVFTFEEKLEDEDIVLAIKERRDAIREMLMSPFEANGSSDEKPKSKKRKVEDDEDEEPPRKKRKVVDEEDEDETPRGKRRKSSDDDGDDEEPTPRKRRSRDTSDDDEDEKPRRKRSVAADDDDDEDEEPRKQRRKSADRDDDDEDEDKPTRKRKPTSDEDDDDEDEPTPRKRRVADEDDEPPRRKKKVVEEDDEDEDEKPKRKKKVVDEDEDEDDEPKSKKRGSRFSK